MRSIDVALAPIISQRGVAALYRRSLFLVRPGHPWLVTVYDAAAIPGDFDALHGAVAGQSAHVALDGTAALLTTFHDLLTSLIGESLTARLLHSIWDMPSSGDAVQDNTQ